MLLSFVGQTRTKRFYLYLYALYLYLLLACLSSFLYKRILFFYYYVALAFFPSLFLFCLAGWVTYEYKKFTFCTYIHCIKCQCYKFWFDNTMESQKVYNYRSFTMSHLCINFNYVSRKVAWATDSVSSLVSKLECGWVSQYVRYWVDRAGEWTCWRLSDRFNSWAGEGMAE